MHTPELHVIPFDVKMDNEGYEYLFEDELIEMYVDLEGKLFFKSENLTEY